jgi:Uma2 family endonuclease
MFDDTNIAINPLAVLPPVKEPRRYTLAEYLRREENSSDLHEYYDGIITKLPMARTPHNRISSNVITALNNVLDAQGKDFDVLGGQQAVYLPVFNISVYPDVLVVSEAPLHWDNNQVLLINPILIVEVLSRSTRAYDRGDKFTKYKSLESLREYVLIDQKQCYIESFYREEPTLWRNSIVKDLSQSLYLKSLDCSIDLAKVYKRVVLKNKVA